MARGHNWRHGWIPLTPRAALAKAHYRKGYAAKLLGHRSASAVGRQIARSKRRARGKRG